MIKIKDLKKSYRKGANAGVGYKALRDVLSHPWQSLKQRMAENQSETFLALDWSTPIFESSFRLVMFGFRSGVKGYV
jgi:hypothetical protein